MQRLKLVCRRRLLWPAYFRLRRAPEAEKAVALKLGSVFRELRFTPKRSQKCIALGLQTRSGAGTAPRVHRGRPGDILVLARLSGHHSGAKRRADKAGSHSDGESVYTSLSRAAYQHRMPLRADQTPRGDRREGLTRRSISCCPPTFSPSARSRRRMALRLAMSIRRPDRRGSIEFFEEPRAPGDDFLNSRSGHPGQAFPAQLPPPARWPRRPRGGPRNGGAAAFHPSSPRPSSPIPAPEAGPDNAKRDGPPSCGPSSTTDVACLAMILSCSFMAASYLAAAFPDHHARRLQLHEKYPPRRCGHLFFPSSGRHRDTERAQGSLLRRRPGPRPAPRREPRRLELAEGAAGVSMGAGVFAILRSRSRYPWVRF